MNLSSKYLLKKKKILILSNSFLFPIRNGMELSVAMHIKALYKSVDFDFHLLNREDVVEKEVSDRKSFNAAYFNNIGVTACQILPVWKRVVNELFLLRPFYDDLDVSSLDFPDIKEYDFVWVTNAKLASVVYYLKDIGAKDMLLTTNDAIYYFYYERSIASLFGREKRSIRSILNLLRLPFLLFNERAYLQAYTTIHVQTELEKKRLQYILPNNCINRICVAPNGIKTELLSLVNNPSSNIILLMNHMTDGREQQALWFFNNIWKHVISERPNLKLLVVGSLPSNSDQVYSGRFPNVEFAGYVNDLESIYSIGCLSVIPHYQSSGYINRLYDAMSAGVPVIISAQIARTVKGFVNGVHGIIASDRRTLIKSIIALSEDGNQRDIFIKNARLFVKEAFQWGTSTSKIKEALQLLEK